MSKALNIIDFDEARAHLLASQGSTVKKEEQEPNHVLTAGVSDKVKQIQNRLFRWKVTAFDLTFGPKLLKCNNASHVAEIVTHLNWKSYRKLSPNGMDQVTDNSSGKFALNGLIHKWEIIDSTNQLGEAKKEIFIEIFSSEVFEKSGKSLVTCTQLERNSLQL